MSKSVIIDTLNPAQREAILHEDGPMLILAGAGSGKTRVITHKFAHLAKKTPPSKILAMTFTNKAAGEMRERIGSLVKKDLREAWVGTFHSQCNRLLRREIQHLGYKNDFTIYDDDDQCTLIRYILKEFKIYEALYKGILSRISSLKSESITADDFLTKGEGYGFEERLARVYVRYQDELRRCNAVDFDDLILLTIKLFKEHPAVLKKYQTQFGHMLVDEFQDTNSAQYKLLRLLSDSHRNICVVGDDDQSIYAFRGANVNNILSFEKDFPGAKVVKLEQNYRSTKNILHVSGTLIQDNLKRRKKTLWCERDTGDKVSYCWFNDEKEEAAYTAKLIREMYLKGMYEYKDFALLYRTNLQAKSLEDALRHERLPYQIIGGTSFYHRKEIKDLTSYMRLAVNGDDNVSLRRIINVPPRGIGASTLAKIEQHAKKNAVSLLAALKSITKNGNLTPATKEKLDSFVKIMDNISSTNFNTAAEMVQAIFENTKYSESVEDFRVENIQEFIKSAEGKDIADFMDMLSLVQTTDEADKGPHNAISLLTLHSAKGLEYPVVFISGLEEGVLPYFKAQTPDEIAEERRLLYVGMTRAKDLLWLTGAGKRKVYAKVQEQEPSRFIASIPKDSCKVMEKYIKKLPVCHASASPHSTVKGKVAKVASPYSIGARVRHPKWGVGIVRDSQGHGDDLKIIVNFPAIGIKRLALKFANLERVT